MKPLFTLLCFLLLVPQIGHSQSKKEKKEAQEKVLDTLQQKIKGVKFADLGFTTAQENLIINNPNAIDAQILLGIRDYLKKDLGLEVVITKEQRIQAVKITTSQCDFVKIEYEIGTFKSKFGAVGTMPFNFSIQFCDKSKYTFEANLSVNGLTNYTTLIRNSCLYRFPLKKGYNKANRMSIPNNPIITTQISFNKYLDSANKKNEIEGLYRLFSTEENTSKYNIGIKLENDTLKIIYLNGADFSEDWKEGELKGYLIKTLSENDYLLKWYSLDKSLIDGSLTFLNLNSFEIRMNAIGYSNSPDKFVRIK